MKAKILIPIIASLVVVALVSAGYESSAEFQFKSWVKEHNKVYSPEEYAYRFGVYQQTVREVNEHNAKYEAGEVTYYTAVNAFADLTDQEFSLKYLDQQMPETDPNIQCSSNQPPSKDLPDQWDWAAKCKSELIQPPSLQFALKEGLAFQDTQSLQLSLSNLVDILPLPF